MLIVNYNYLQLTSVLYNTNTRIIYADFIYYIFAVFI